MIVATLWGTVAEKLKSEVHLPIAIRKGVVGSFQDNVKIIRHQKTHP